MTLETTADGEGDREGFGGRRYRSGATRAAAYDDTYDDFPAFLEPRLREARRLLHPTGTLYVHLDYREAHYVKILLDEIFGREAFLNELIWAYDYGARPSPTAGPQSTTRSWCTCENRASTCSTPTRWIASRTWPQGW